MHQSESQSKLDNLVESEQSLKLQMQELTAKKEALENEITVVTEKFEKKLSDLEESNRDHLQILESEKSLILRDLNMQLEIANAQRSEFEELSAQLKEEIKDLYEERKIGDKKGSALIKDLKRQLLSEKQRNERLQEKMKECFSGVSTPDPLSSGGGAGAGGGKDLDPDRSSISSWSMMSGQNDRASTPIPTSSGM